MLCTTAEIAEMYSSKGNEVSVSMITKSWIPKGLKHIRGKRKAYLIKPEWVDEFLEEQSFLNIIQRSDNKKITRNRKKIIKNCECRVH